MNGRPPRAIFPRVTGCALGALLVALTWGCDDGPGQTAEETRDPVTGLTPTESREVLAQVGEHKITLGEYALTLARMGKFEKLRFQTPERQRELLEEMIDVELLAQEAKRRGLDGDPEVVLKLHQALRDEVLEELRRSLPPLESWSEREVRAYYDAHKDEFQEPERRRVLAIVVSGKKIAEKIAREAQGASGPAWGELAKKHSIDRRGLGDGAALDWAGDLGFVSAPGEARGENGDVPAAVRVAVFGLEKLGEVAPEPVQVGNVYYVVRHGGTSPARERSFRDAERTIRVELRRQKFLEEERALEEELAKKYPVTVDDKALAELEAQRASARDKTLEKDAPPASSGAPAPSSPSPAPSSPAPKTP